MDSPCLTADALRQRCMDSCINYALWNTKNHWATYASDKHYLECRFPLDASVCNDTLFKYGAKTKTNKDYGLHVFYRDFRLNNFYHPVLYFPTSCTTIPF